MFLVLRSAQYQLFSLERENITIVHTLIEAKKDGCQNRRTRKVKCKKGEAMRHEWYYIIIKPKCKAIDICT